jgi:hypothetical protein
MDMLFVLCYVLFPFHEPYDHISVIVKICQLVTLPLRTVEQIFQWLKYKKQNTEGRKRVPMHLDRDQSLVQPISSFIQQSSKLNRVHYLANRIVFKVTWCHKMMTQVPES